jgi:hypothetical protein
MRFLLFLTTLLYTVNAMVDMKAIFEDWKVQNGKKYDTALEHRYRFSVFTENYANIQCKKTLNKIITIGLNKFADLTAEELNLT